MGQVRVKTTCMDLKHDVTIQATKALGI